ncbi:hypothetical protein THRCLA_06997 [Thraustotheca clavata]|uniref:RING-type domain-containing protein n=1 Tax=Thraustotheca clavata TaxID=74557 RepID=A0A1V9ZHA7_9STRA|nr:hypothetical protein THRCLA_06997 [Thraustotheca clavata]
MSHDPSGHEPYHYSHHGMLDLNPSYNASFQMQMHQHHQQQQQQQLPEPTPYQPMQMHNNHKRKAPTSPPSSYLDAVPAPNTTTTNTSTSSQPTCDVCKYPDPILYVPECGHTFHSRCVGVWPMLTCPYCQGNVAKVAVVQVDMTSKPTQRSGKWTKQEEKFVTMIVDEFDHGTFPLANGTPVRLVLAKLLNCSPMRLSKKFQKNALGKRTYRVPKTSNNGFRICFDTESHQARQIEFSAAESAFRQEVVMLQRKDNARQDGFLELHDLRLAVIQFWVSNFLKFAMSVGQQVDGLDTTEPKKKKQAMQKLREGMFDQLLSWSNNNSNGNEENVKPSRPTMPEPTPAPNMMPPQHPNMGNNSPWDTPFIKTNDSSDNQSNDSMFLNGPPMYGKPPAQGSSFRQQLDKHDGNNNNNNGVRYREAMPPLQPTYNAPNVYDYKRRTTSLTPLSMRSGGTRLPDSIFEDHANTPSSALDAVLMNTPTNMTYRQPMPNNQATNYDPIQQYPTNPSWDQMLDDFTGINTQLVVDPALHAWSNIQLT